MESILHIRTPRSVEEQLYRTGKQVQNLAGNYPISAQF